MSRYKKEPFLIALALILAVPVPYHGLPLYFFMPDIQFVKAKILHVMEGSLYADPATGFPTLHPPYYHLLLSFFAVLSFFEMKCYRIDDIERHCRKYNINTAVVPRYKEMEMPVFKAIANHWRLVYHDPYFLVYRRAS